MKLWLGKTSIPSCLNVYPTCSYFWTVLHGARKSCGVSTRWEAFIRPQCFHHLVPITFDFRFPVCGKYWKAQWQGLPLRWRLEYCCTPSRACKQKSTAVWKVLESLQLENVVRQRSVQGQNSWGYVGGATRRRYRGQRMSRVAQKRDNWGVEVLQCNEENAKLWNG